MWNVYVFLAEFFLLGFFSGAFFGVWRERRGGWWIFARQNNQILENVVIERGSVVTQNAWNEYGRDLVPHGLHVGQTYSARATVR